MSEHVILPAAGFSARILDTGSGGYPRGRPTALPAWECRAAKIVWEVSFLSLVYLPHPPLPLRPPEPPPPPSPHAPPPSPTTSPLTPPHHHQTPLHPNPPTSPRSPPSTPPPPPKSPPSHQAIRRESNPTPPQFLPHLHARRLQPPDIVIVHRAPPLAPALVPLSRAALPIPRCPAQTALSRLFTAVVPRPTSSASVRRLSVRIASIARSEWGLLSSAASVVRGPGQARVPPGR